MGSTDPLPEPAQGILQPSDTSSHSNSTQCSILSRNLPVPNMFCSVLCQAARLGNAGHTGQQSDTVGVGLTTQRNTGSRVWER